MWWRLLLNAALLLLPTMAASTDTLCSLTPVTYPDAKKKYPKLTSALTQVEQHGIATWYTDRLGGDVPYARLGELLAKCGDSTRLSVVVYGLPNKDCSAGESNSGSVKTADDYRAFLTTLQQTLGDRKVLYIVEPDAMGLLVTDGCAKTNKYDESLATAVSVLSTNPNADLYVDVGFWVINREDYLATVVANMKQLLEAGRVKGIAINTSNYRSNSEMSPLCGKFRKAMGNDTLHCVIDTSRNYNGGSSKGEWCNYKNAGIGSIPTGDTNDTNIDYYLWIKPPGESDGVCTGRTSDAMEGPPAGDFFYDGFVQQWNRGSPVMEMKLAKIGGGSSSTTTIILVCVGIVVLIAVVLGGAFFWRRRSLQQQAKQYYTGP